MGEMQITDNTAGTTPEEIITSMSAYFSDLVGNLGHPLDVMNISGNSGLLHAAPMDLAWGSDETAIDKFFDNKALKIEYARHCNQVETLIREAGSLVERSLRDLSKYDELNVEKFKTFTEFLQYIRTRSLEKDEEGDGTYWPELENEAIEAARARRDAIGDADGIISTYKAALGAYQRAHDNTKDVASQQSFAATKLTTQIAETLYSAQQQANGSDASSHDHRQNYERRRSYYLGKRRQIVQDVVAIKLYEMKNHLGALNYRERMHAIADRAKADFLETYVPIERYCVRPTRILCDIYG
jgi:hypothetical protein